MCAQRQYEELELLLVTKFAIPHIAPIMESMPGSKKITCGLADQVAIAQEQ